MVQRPYCVKDRSGLVYSHNDAFNALEGSDPSHTLPERGCSLSGEILNLHSASSTPLPLHSSTSFTCSGLMKALELREANTIWAAAALITGLEETPSSRLALSPSDIPLAFPDNIGTTGLVANGGLTAELERLVPRQLAARWNIQKVSISSVVRSGTAALR